MSDDAAVVLAAGKGTRMRSSVPKVLQPLAGKSMLARVLDGLAEAGFPRPWVVVGHDASRIKEVTGDRVNYVTQDQLLGTGHAAKTAIAALPANIARVLLIHGDEPMVPPTIYRDMLELHSSSGAPVVLLTTVCDDTRRFGRVIRGASGRPESLVQEDELSLEQRAIAEVNLGVYVFDAEFLREQVEGLEPHPPKGEYFLTDLVARALELGQEVQAVTMEGGADVMGINSLGELDHASAELFKRKNASLMETGVQIVGSHTVFIEDDVEILPETVILPFSLIRGKTHIGRGSTVGPSVVITDSEIGDACEIQSSTIKGARIGDGVRVGPYAHLRPGTVLGPGVEVGSHAEIKASHLGRNTRMHHFGYVGDAEVGEEVNIGAGVVTCNFDGQEKHATTVGDGAFLGSDTMLRAPVKVGARSYTGAGSVVTRDVEPGEMVAGVPAKPIKGKERTRDSGQGVSRDGSKEES